MLSDLSSCFALFFRRRLLFVWFLSVVFLNSGIAHCQDDEKSSSSPDMADFFDTEWSEIAPQERPTEPKLVLPDSLDKVSLPTPSDERNELSAWVRWLVLRNLPPSFEDNRKWGKHKEVFDGLEWRREGWKVETKRKSKSVKQGTWSRYFIEFVDPSDLLRINIQSIDFPKQGVIRVVTQVVAPLRLFGRVSQWQRDVQLVSISTNADATLELNLSCDIQMILNPLKIPPDVEFRPVVTDASVSLLDFEVHRISQIHGPLAELLGKGIREVLDRRLQDYREKLVTKMNSEIAKQQSKLKLSVQDWLKTSVSKKAN